MKRSSSVTILGVLMGYLPLLPADERKSSASNPKTEQRTYKFNVTGPTAGGKQFWTDFFIYDFWRIQRNVFTGHCRLLDDENHRRSWGTFENCRRKFDSLKGELQLPRMGSEVEIAVHGLGRTRDSMAGIGRYLAEAGARLNRFPNSHRMKDLVLAAVIELHRGDQDVTRIKEIQYREKE